MHMIIASMITTSFPSSVSLRPQRDVVPDSPHVLEVIKTVLCSGFHVMALDAVD